MTIRSDIEAKLTHLYALERERQALAQPYDDQIAALQATITAQITALQDKKNALVSDVAYRINQLEQEITTEAVSVGESVKVEGVPIQAVYYKEAYQWDKDKLLGFAAAHPELMTIAKKTPAKVQLRRG